MLWLEEKLRGLGNKIKKWLKLNYLIDGPLMV
jgi:hypothetical protein